VKDDRLQYYMHDDADAFRFELSGSLSGDGVRSMDHAWRTALSIIGERPLVADITYVTDADARGRALLLLWRRLGMRIIAASAESRALVETVPGEPLVVAESAPAIGWLQRLFTVIRGRASAGIPASAEQHKAASAPAPGQGTEFTAVAEYRELEHRVF